jgi:hypothetical protein
MTVMTARRIAKRNALKHPIVMPAIVLDGSELDGGENDGFDGEMLDSIAGVEVGAGTVVDLPGDVTVENVDSFKSVDVEEFSEVDKIDDDDDDDDDAACKVRPEQ